MKKFLLLSFVLSSFYFTAQSFPSGQQFIKNSKMYSPSRTFYLIFQTDGNLVIYNSRSRESVWSSKTTNAGSRVEFQSDGNLVIYNNSSKAIFSSNTSNRGNILKIQDDGNLVIYNSNDNPIWSSIENKRNNGEETIINTNVIRRGYKLRVDEKVYSPGKEYYYLFQNDGNLVIYYRYNEAIWNTNTKGRGVSALFQADGNLVIYDVRNQPVFSSNTANKGEILKLQDDGNLVIYDSNENAVWASK